MSWWIGVEGVGTPEDEISRNVTYNVGGMFRLALAIPLRGIHRRSDHYSCRCERSGDGSHEIGLQALDGAPCVEAAGVIAAALRRMADDPAPYRAMNPANGWGPSSPPWMICCGCWSSAPSIRRRPSTSTDPYSRLDRRCIAG